MNLNIIYTGRSRPLRISIDMSQLESKFLVNGHKNITDCFIEDLKRGLKISTVKAKLRMRLMREINWSLQHVDTAKLAKHRTKQNPKR